jgi:DNA-binding NtrC family response regulator
MSPDALQRSTGLRPPGPQTPWAFAGLNLVGRSAIFLEALELLERVASCEATTLIRGETGTGKELAARAIHYLGTRRDSPFIPVNCGALPDTLLESELFGHERGAFTDAHQARYGLVAQAEGGTLFLDEVEAMTPRAQVVLLRFLQDRKYRPVGGTMLATGDVRIVASSNVDLEDLVGQQQFRRDLLFRLGVLTVTMPPLRQRGDDVILLAEEFVRRFSAQHRRPVKPLHPDATAWLIAYGWPGNVRELENLMLREVLLSDGDCIDVPGRRRQPVDAAPETAGLDDAFKAAKARAVAIFEKTYLSRLLARTGGNVSLAARLSGKDRSSVNKLLRKHGLVPERFRSIRERG